MSEWSNRQVRFLDALLEGNSAAAVSLARDSLSAGAQPVEFFDQCVAPSLAEIGRRFERLDIFLPEMVTAADVVEIVNSEVINPAVEAGHASATRAKGKVLLATVQGDLHDIGKNMVGLMLKVNGFEVIDLGTNVSPSDIVERAERDRVDIVALSTLLTTCLPYVKDVCDFLESKGIRHKFPVIIGGAATNPKLAEEVGANAHGASAAEAVKKCAMLLGKL